MTSTANALWASPPAHEIKKVGVQLYTVRHLMKDDFDGTIAGIAKIGFKEVEFAGYFGKRRSVGRDARRPAGHRFQHRKPESFIERWHNETIGR